MCVHRLSLYVTFSAKKCHIEFSSKGNVLGKTNPILTKTKGTSGNWNEVLELNGVDETTPFAICSARHEIFLNVLALCIGGEPVGVIEIGNVVTAIGLKKGEEKPHTLAFPGCGKVEFIWTALDFGKVDGTPA